MQVEPAMVSEVFNGQATSDSTQSGSVSSGTNTILVCLPPLALRLCYRMDDVTCLTTALLAS